MHTFMNFNYAYYSITDRLDNVRSFVRDPLRTNYAHLLTCTQFLDKITYWTVNCGVLTSITGIVVIVTFSAMPDNMVYLAVHLLLSKRACSSQSPNLFSRYRPLPSLHQLSSCNVRAQFSSRRLRKLINCLA